MKGWTFLILLLIVPSALGLGVAQDYLEGDTLRLLQGETHYLKIILQNPDDSNVAVKLSVNGEIATIYDPQDVYNLSAKSYDNVIYLKVVAPQDSKVGDDYKVTYSVTPINQNEEGMVGMNMKITRNFDVLIVNEDGVGSNAGEIFGESGTSIILKIVMIALVVVFLIGVGVLIAKRSSHMSDRILTWWNSRKNKKQSEKKVENPSKVEDKIIRKPLTSNPFMEKASEIKLYFNLEDGTTLRSVIDLYHYLHIMSQDEFSHHVNGKKNDFATWVGDVFSLNKLAKKMKKCKTREEMRKVIKYEMDK